MVLLLTTAALALELTVTVSPGEGGALAQALTCTAGAVKQGELLSLPPQQVGQSTVVPLLEVGSQGAWGVVWLSALRVQSAGGPDYPGLISIARPDRGQDLSRPCALGETCTHVYTRDEQSMTVSVLAAGVSSGVEVPEELIWRTTSWYREAREIACQ